MWQRLVLAFRIIWNGLTDPRTLAAVKPILAAWAGHSQYGLLFKCALEVIDAIDGDEPEPEVIETVKPEEKPVETLPHSP